MDTRRDNKRSYQVGMSVKKQTLMALHPEIIQIALSRLDVHSLARFAAAAKDLQQHAEAVLRQRIAERRREPTTGRPRFEYIYSDQDPIPIGFSTWASYLAWFEYITLMINHGDYRVRIMALQKLDQLAPVVLAQPQYAGAALYLLSDEHREVRRSALSTMGRLDLVVLAQPQYARAVVSRLSDVDSWVRRQATDTMERLDSVVLAQLALFGGIGTTAVRQRRRLKAQ